MWALHVAGRWQVLPPTPVFFLKPAGGAIGAHVEAVRACYDDFLDLAKQIADKSGFAAELIQAAAWN